MRMFSSTKEFYKELQDNDSKLIIKNQEESDIENCLIKKQPQI